MTDPTRREFFRQFAGDLVSSAAQVVGAVTELRDRSASEAAALLGDPPAVPAGTSGAMAGAPRTIISRIAFAASDALWTGTSTRASGSLRWSMTSRT